MQNFSKQLSKIPNVEDMFKLLDTDPDRAREVDKLVKTLKAEVKHNIEISVNMDIYCNKIANYTYAIQHGDNVTKKFIFALNKSNNYEECGKILGLSDLKWNFVQIMLQFKVLEDYFKESPENRNSFIEKLKAKFNNNIDSLIDSFFEKKSLSLFMLSEKYPENFSEEFCNLMYEEIKKFIFN